MVYKPDSQPSKEGDKLKPWSKIAVFKLQAEEQLAKIEGYVLIIQAAPSKSGANLVRDIPRSWTGTPCSNPFTVDF